MVWMKYFCFCVPVRLGVVITSALTLIENLILLIGCLLYDAETISKKLDGLKDNSRTDSQDSATKELYEDLIDFTQKYSVEMRFTTIGVLAACILCCCMNIYAAFTKRKLFAIPFIIVRFFEIIVFFILHVNFMLYTKKSVNLGILIAACCLGGFFILLLLYFWGVTVAMFQIIGIVNSEYYKQMIKMNTIQTKVVTKAKNQEVATITAKADEDNSLKMVASDFRGIYKGNIRRI